MTEIKALVHDVFGTVVDWRGAVTADGEALAARRGITGVDWQQFADEWRGIAAMPTWRAGFPSRTEAIRRYAARTGFDVGAVGWHQVFAAFKLAVIIQQIYARWKRGQTRDERFAVFGERVRLLIEYAAAQIGM